MVSLNAKVSAYWDRSCLTALKSYLGALYGVYDYAMHSEVRREESRHFRPIVHQ